MAPTQPSAVSPPSSTQPISPSPPAAPASERPGAERARPASDAKERREALVSHLRAQGSTSVANLPRLFGVSIETIRRDLRLLESTGRIRRSEGRVAAADSGSFESSREFRVSHLVDEKERIARAAVEHLGTAETVFLDEGFHPLLVGRALPADRDLTIVTASLPTAIELADRPRTQVVVIGGRIRPITLAAVERWATRMLREMEPDLAIVGANGVNEEGWLTTPHASVAEVKETVLATAHRAVFVGSHTKFGHSTFARFGHVRHLERVITGRELRSSTARRLTELGAVIERV
jgi:transcriptional regulator, DeoR family